MDFPWGLLIPIILFASILIFMWGILDTSLLIRQGGSKLKRGIKLASKPLEPEFFNFLETLEEEVEEKKQILFKEVTVGFIRIHGRERLIHARKSRWRTSWPYIGYIDFRQPTPALEFRASLPMHLFLLPFVITIIFIPFVALFMFFNYRQETKSIEEFIQRQITVPGD